MREGSLVVKGDNGKFSNSGTSGNITTDLRASNPLKFEFRKLTA